MDMLRCLIGAEVVQRSCRAVAEVRCRCRSTGSDMVDVQALRCEQRC